MPIGKVGHEQSQRDEHHDQIDPKKQMERRARKPRCVGHAIGGTKDDIGDHGSHSPAFEKWNPPTGFFRIDPQNP